METDRLSIPSRDRFHGPTIVEPVPPTWRDIPRILLRRYTPRVRIYTTLTVAGVDRDLKRLYKPEILERMQDTSPLLEALDLAERQP